MIEAFARDWRDAGLDTATIALLEYAELLTRSPSLVTPDHIQTLRSAGWDDRAITDATQVCAYFNYINRIAEGLGVDEEGWLDDQGRPR